MTTTAPRPQSLGSLLHDLAEKVGEVGRLDAVASPATAAVDRLVGRGTVKNLLTGTWLGHSLHPLLTDIPIGSFTSASVLDLIGGRSGRRAADRLVALGLASSVVTAAAGAADWADTHGASKRIGVVHAVANAVGVGLYAASAVARRRGRRVSGTVLGLAGMSTMTVGGYLGGHLSYVKGVGVNHAFAESPPDEWTPVLEDRELTAGRAHKVAVDGAEILLWRDGDSVHAIGSRCSHAGGPLADGDIDADTCAVTCPWHGSRFRLDSGEVEQGPASVPQTAYDTRVTAGRLEVRRRR